MAKPSLLTNHGHALLCVAREPGTRLRDIAQSVGLTERATHRIVCELEEAGYLTRSRVGRNNFYEVHVHAPLTHPLEETRTVGDLLSAMLEPRKGQQAA